MYTDMVFKISCQFLIGNVYHVPLIIMLVLLYILLVSIPYR